MAQGVIIGGGVENLKKELTAQIDLLNQAKENLVGKTSGANAVAADIVKGKTAYVGQELVVGTLEKSEDGTNQTFGREKSTLELNKTEINLSVDKPTDTITVTTNSDGQLSIENSIGQANAQIQNKTITFIKGKKKENGKRLLQLNKTEMYRKNQKEIHIACDPTPHAKGTELDTSLITSNMKNLTGIISFTGPLSSTGEDYSKVKDGSIKCTIKGQNAIISGNGGILAPSNCSSMFESFKAAALDLSSFDTSKVINMNYMFQNSQAVTIDLSNFDTSKVTDMSVMFQDSQAATLDLSSFDTSNVTDMHNMFKFSQVTILDLSSFDTSRVTNMGNMFAYSQATTLDLSSFDTSNVTDMYQMFFASEATTLDLSSFDTSNVTYMGGMFSYSNATTIYCRTEEDKQRFLASDGCKPTADMFIVGKPPVA